MSKVRIDLKDRRIATTVLVVLALIIVVNVQAFMPDLKRFATSTGPTHDEVPVPADLNESAQLASSRLADFGLGSGSEVARLLASDVGSGGRSGRDPFQLGAVPAAGKKTGKQVAAVKVQTNSEVQELICSAVLLAGELPTALINSKAYRVGDLVAGYRLARVSLEGALLVGTGEDIFLPVGSRSAGGICYPPVSESGEAATSGQLRGR